MLTLKLAGHVSAEDKQNNDYRYVPFELARPAGRLHVSYRYSATVAEEQQPELLVIDLGLFDPRGTDFPGSAGFRGWSGGARSEFTITPTDATPGYLPGPLPAGQYQVILGLYRIPPGGADYMITIAIEPADDQQPATTVQPAANAKREHDPEQQESCWLRGDLQSHTEHSDARGTLAQLTAKARALELDFLAITDHNTVSHHAHLEALADAKLLLIPGQEVTTYYGHMNVWGTSRWCDFRCRNADDMAAVIALAHAHGGVCSINHPKRGGPAWEYDTSLPVDALEVWQGPWPWRNTESLALWDRLLQRGQRLPVVGGSDYHCPAGEDTSFLRLGQPTTWVKADERSIPAILAAISAGRASISAAPDGPRLDLRATVGRVAAEMGESLPCVANDQIDVEVQIERGTGWTLRLIVDGEIAHTAPISAASATVRHTLAAQRYIRAELVGDAPPAIIPPHAPPDLDLREWRWALSNPIYIEPV